MSRKIHKKRKLKRSVLIFLLIFIFIIFITGYKIYKEEIIQNNQELLQKDILKHYNKYVVTTKDTKLYILSNSKYQLAGNISKNEELTLETKEITYKDEYLKITTFEEEYYIYYKDIESIESLKEYSNRYRKYIPFNQNIITKEITNFYDEEDVLVYTINSSYNLPIIIKTKEKYGIEFNNRLLYIKKEDVLKIEDNNNTTKTNTKGIAVLNYHFFYNTELIGDAAKCNQSICLSTTNLKKHLDYIKNNDIFTPNMTELEMYIDSQIQLPKSVVLTIDDGWRADNGSNIMAEYKLNATVFLMSKYYNPDVYKNEYVEVHSHGHDLHNQGVCPGGQGGAIKCLEKTKLLSDLSASRKKLYNSTVFCYPFYEYNSYSIEVLKEAGFTMAFGGYGEAGKYKVSPGINKFKLPRYVIYSNTSVNNIASYIN